MTDGKKFQIFIPGTSAPQIWDEDKLMRNREQLYKDHNDVQVTQFEDFNPETTHEEGNMYQVQIPGLNPQQWDRGRLDRNYAQLMKDHPDAKVTTLRRDPYWQEKAVEQKGALDAFDAEYSDFMRGHDMNRVIKQSYDEAGMDAPTTKALENYDADEEKYVQLKALRDQLQSDYSNNPYILESRGNATKMASEKEKELRELAGKESNFTTSSYGLVTQASDESKKLTQAADLQNKIAKLWSAPSNKSTKDDSKNGFVSYMDEYGRGAKDVATDWDFWTRGLSEIDRNINVSSIVKKLKSKDIDLNNCSPEDIDKNLSTGEKELLSSWAQYAQAQSERAHDISRAYSAGQSAAESAGYMAEFLIAGGISSAMGNGIREGAETGLRAWIGRALADGNQAAIRRAGIDMATKGGEVALTKGAKVAIKAAEGAYKYGVRPITQAVAHTVLQPATYRQISNDLFNAQMSQDVVNYGHEIWNSVLDSLIENWSESMGVAVEDALALPFKGISKSAQKAGITSWKLGDISVEQWGKLLAESKPAKILHQAGFNGFIGEMGEEWLGNAARVLVNEVGARANGVKPEDYDKGMKASEYKDWMGIKSQLDMAASFAPMSLFGLASTTVASMRQASKYAEAVDKMGALLKSEKYGFTKEEVERLFKGTLTQEDITKLIEHGGLTPDVEERLKKEMSKGYEVKQTKEQIANILEPYMRRVLENSANATTKAEKAQAEKDIKTIFEFAQSQYMGVVANRAREEYRQLQRNKLEEDITTALGGKNKDEEKGRYYNTTEVELGDGTKLNVNTVTTMTDERGTWFVLGNGGDQLLLKKVGTQEVATISKEDYDDAISKGKATEKVQRKSEYLNETLDARMAEQERLEMNTKFTNKRTALIERLNENPFVHFGDNKDGQVREVHADGVVIQFPEEVELNGKVGKVHKVGYEQVGNAIGIDQKVKTQEQLDWEKADKVKIDEMNQRWVNRHAADKTILIDGEAYQFVVVEGVTADENGNDVYTIIATDADGNTREVNTTYDELKKQIATQEESALQERVVSEETTKDIAPRDYKGDPLPIKMVDGKEVVDQEALWGKDKRAWYLWNDSRRGGDTTNSKAKLDKNIAELTAKRDKMQAEYDKADASNDFDTTDRLEGELQSINADINELQSIRADYDKDAQQAALDSQYQERLEYLDAAERNATSVEQLNDIKIERARVIDEYIGTINNSGIEVEVATKDSIFLVMLQDKLTLTNPSDIAQMEADEKALADALGSGVMVYGFYCSVTDKMYMLADNVYNISDARKTYIHENQHRVNYNTKADLALARVASQEELVQAVSVLSGTSYYNGKDVDELADEVIAHAMELVVTHPHDDVAQLLLGQGVTSENIINFINNIEDEQRKASNDPTLTRQSTFNGNRTRVTGEGDGGYQGAESTAVEEQGAGTPEYGAEQLGSTTVDINEISNLFDGKEGAVLLGTEAVAINEGNGIRFNVKTWEEGGREALAAYLASRVKEGKLGQADADNLLAEMDRLATMAKNLADGEPNGLFSQWSVEEVRTKEGTSIPVLHALKNNSDYELNIDFSTVCKKRQVIDHIFNKMIRDGYLTGENLSDSDIARMNQIIQKHGLEIACGICFVDSRRYNSYIFANGFLNKYNPIVASLVRGRKFNDWKEAVDSVAGYNYADNQEFSNEGKQDLSQITEVVDWDNMFDANGNAVGLDNYMLNWRGIVDMFTMPRTDSKGNEKQSVFAVAMADKEANPEKSFSECLLSACSSSAEKMAFAISQSPRLRKLAKAEDFIASEGWTNILAENDELEKLWNIQKGAAGARPNEDNAQYQSEVLDKKITGDIYDIAGYRMQSFSDFIGRMYFDYLQAFADLAALGIPGHAYTKEPNFVKLFGLMGMKVNMSLVSQVDNNLTDTLVRSFMENGMDEKSAKEEAKKYAGLTYDANGNLTYNFYITVKDNEGNILRQGQTFPPDEAFRLQDDPRYSKTSGTIAVGLSYHHILMMLRDRNIRMVIPYHKSGLPHGVALVYSLEEVNDYTKSQNTRGKGKLSDDQKKVMKKRVDNFNFTLHQLTIAEDKLAAYNALRLLQVRMEGNKYGDASKVDKHETFKEIYDAIRNGEITEGLQQREFSDRFDSEDFLPKVAADIYKEACDSWDYIPKFNEFANEQGYYKVLIDFAVYDNEGNYAPQEDIHFEVPEDFENLVKEALAEDESIHEKEMAETEPVIEEIEKYLDQTELRAEQDRIAAKDKPNKAETELMRTNIYNVGDNRNFLLAENEGKVLQFKNGKPVLTNLAMKVTEAEDPEVQKAIDFINGKEVEEMPSGLRFMATSDADFSKVDTDNPAIVGSNEFGSVYQWKPGYAVKGFKLLLSKKSGYLKDAFYSKRLGYVGIPWGDERKGLYHIISKHIDELGDFELLADVAEAIENCLQYGVRKPQQNKIAFDYDGYRTSIMPDGDKDWIITAFDTTKSVDEKKESKTTTKTSDQSSASEKAGTHSLSNLTSSSSDKDTNNSETSNTESTISNALNAVEGLNMDKASGEQLMFKVTDPTSIESIKDEISEVEKFQEIPEEQRSKVQNWRISQLPFYKSLLAEQESKDEKSEPTTIRFRTARAGTAFSGAGLIEAGLSGLIEPQFAIEYNEKISGVYAMNHGNHIITADIGEVDIESLPTNGGLDYFHASPVCKRYSTMNNNAGETPLDRKTAKATADIISTKKPRIVTIENVAGYRGSEAMGIITKALDDNGYKWDANVYDASDYGSATSRKRLIVRAVKEGELPPVPTKNAEKKSWDSVIMDIIETLPDSQLAPWMKERLDAEGVNYTSPGNYLFVFDSGTPGGKARYAWGGKPLPTITASGSADRIILPDGRVKLADGRVLARITGLPDSFKLPESRTLSHTIVGNGVPVELTKAVIAPLLDSIEGDYVNEGIRFRISEARKKTMASQMVNKLTFMTPEQIDNTIATIERLGEESKNGGDSKLENSLLDWVCRGMIVLPDDQEKAILAYNYAKRFNKSTNAITNINSFIDLMSTEVEKREADKKPLDPDTVPEFTNKTVVSEAHGIIVYDVPDSREGQRAVRRIVDSHFGYNANPWCLISRLGDGDTLKSAWGYWNSYNGAGRKIAFQNGRLIAFMSSGSSKEQWWDRLDRAHDKVPVMIKFTTEKGNKVSAQTSISSTDADALVYDNIYTVSKGNVEETFDSNGDIVSTKYSAKRDGAKETVTIEYTRMGSRLGNPIEQVKRGDITTAAEVRPVRSFNETKAVANGNLVEIGYHLKDGEVMINRIAYKEIGSGSAHVVLYSPGLPVKDGFSTKRGNIFVKGLSDEEFAAIMNEVDIKPSANKQAQVLRYQENDAIVELEDSRDIEVESVTFYPDASNVNDKIKADVGDDKIIIKGKGTALVIDRSTGEEIKYFEDIPMGGETLKPYADRILGIIERAMTYEPRIVDGVHATEKVESAVIRKEVDDANERVIAPEKKTTRAITALDKIVKALEAAKKHNDPMIKGMREDLQRDILWFARNANNKSAKAESAQRMRDWVDTYGDVDEEIPNIRSNMEYYSEEEQEDAPLAYSYLYFQYAAKHLEDKRMRAIAVLLDNYLYGYIDNPYGAAAEDALAGLDSIDTPEYGDIAGLREKEQKWNEAYANEEYDGIVELEDAAFDAILATAQALADEVETKQNKSNGAVTPTRQYSERRNRIWDFWKKVVDASNWGQIEIAEIENRELLDELGMEGYRELAFNAMEDSELVKEDPALAEYMYLYDVVDDPWDAWDRAEYDGEEFLRFMEDVRPIDAELYDRVKATIEQYDTPGMQDATELVNNVNAVLMARQEELRAQLDGTAVPEDSIADSMETNMHKVATSVAAILEPKLAKMHDPVATKIYDDFKANDDEKAFVDNLIKHYNDLQTKPWGEAIRFKVTERNEEERARLFDAAKSYYGTTNDFREAGYLIPDGSMLDFSEKQWGGQAGRRSLDHRGIAGGLYEYNDDKDPNLDTNMDDFVCNGGIRLIDAWGGINIGMKPTKEQTSVLRDYIYRHGGAMILEFNDKTGRSDAYAQYEKRTSPTKIINDIKAYFDDGIKPVGTMRFRAIDITPEVREEMEVIEATARVNGTYPKAPNGADTHLNPEQWAMVRTSTFKDWFGDWEKSARIKKLLHSKTAVITGTEIAVGKDYKETRKNALEYGKTLRGEYINRDTGNKLILYSGKNGGVKEILEHDYKDTPHLLSIAAIPQIAENSIYIDSRENEDMAKHPDIVRYDYYVCGLKIGDEDYTVKAAIAVAKNGQKYYDHKLTAIEKGKLIDELARKNLSQSGLSSVEAQGETNASYPTVNGEDITSSPISVVKDIRLLSLLQDNSSKVINAETGEPMVVYHGTPRFGFTIFNEDRDRGVIYTTTRRTVAANYGGQGYAAVREIRKGIKEGDSIDTIISNWESFTGQKVRVATPEERERSIADCEAKAIEVKNRLEELYKDYNGDLPNDESGEAGNAVAWMANLFYDAANHVDMFEAGNDTYDIISKDVTHYQESKDYLRKYRDNNYEALCSEEQRGNKAIIDFLLHWESGDVAIDIQYGYMNAVYPNDVLIDEMGSIALPGTIKDSIDKAKDIGAYQLFGFANNILEVECNENQWYNIEFNGVKTSTDDIVRWAKENGYDAVHFANIYDYGDLADDYVFFDSNQVKSADPVTYDDKGNVIPLSERFNKANPDIRFRFIGEKGAERMDNEDNGTRMSNLDIANKMEEKGRPARLIKMATGWERGADGKWRYEESDFRLTSIKKCTFKEGQVKRITDIIPASDNLFKEYPSLKDYLVKAEPMEEDSLGYHIEDMGIALSFNEMDEVEDGNRMISDQSYSTLVHEIQHAIQYLEGFATGSDSSLDGEDEYNSSAGEVEARNVSDRMKMSDESRRLILAKDTEDTPREKQTVRFRIGEPTPVNAIYGRGLIGAVGIDTASDMLLDAYGRVPESVKDEMSRRSSARGFDFTRGISEYYASLVDKDTLTEDEANAVSVMRENLEDIANDRLDINEVLFAMWNTIHNGHTIFDEAERAEVADRLGLSPQAIAEDKETRSNLRFRIRESMISTSAANMYNRSVGYWKNRLKEGWIDMYESVNDLVDAIEKASGSKAESFEDARLSLNQMTSKGANQMQRYIKDYLEPMWKVLGDIEKILAGDTKLTHDEAMEMISRYVMLKHAIERNEVFAKRDARDFYQQNYDELVAPMKKEIKTLEKGNKAIEKNDGLTDEEKQRAIDKNNARIDELNEAIDKQEAILDKHLRMTENGTSAKYHEFREQDYGGLTSLLADYPGLQERNAYPTEEAYLQAVRLARKPRYSDVVDMENAAKAEVEEFEKKVGKYDIDELWMSIRKATERTVQMQYEAGMISAELKKHLIGDKNNDGMFQFYVPLRGFKDVEAHDIWTYYGAAQNVGTIAPVKKSKGRTTEAENPFLWIGTQASTAIAQDVKNQAKLALYYFIVNRPNQDLVTIGDAWYEWNGEMDGKKKVFVPAIPPFTDGMDGATAKTTVENWENAMKEKAKEGNARKADKHLNISDDAVFINRSEGTQHTISVNVNGAKKVLYINGSPRAAQAINGLLNVETEQNQTLAGLLRWMSSVNTSYNPEFWISNLQRDLLFGAMSMNIKGDGNIFDNLVSPARMMRLMKAYDEGRLDELKGKDKEYADYYKEFAEGGAITGYTVIVQNEEWQEEIRKAIDPSMWNKMEQSGILQAFQNLGEAVEQITRFSAFVQARKNGKGIEQAVADAKDITVNFNRKGSGKAISNKDIESLTHKNGTKLSKAEKFGIQALSLLPAYGRRCVMFFNAAMQGLNAMVLLARKDTKKFIPWMLGYFMVGVAQAVLHALLPDDDDYLDMPDFTRQNNLLLGFGGIYFKWALPQEARIFYALGDEFVNLAMGRRKNRNWFEEAGTILSQIGEMLPVNLLEGLSSLDERPLLHELRALAPSYLTPIVDVMMNENFAGYKVHSDNRYLSDEEKKRTPKSQNAFSGTGIVWIDVAKALNYVTGGDKYHAGGLNVAAEDIKHIVESLGGGTLTTLNKVFDTMEGVAGLFGIGEGEITIKRLPFVNRVLVYNGEQTKNSYVNEMYKYYKSEAEHYDKILKEAKKSKDTEWYHRLRYSSDREISRIYDRYESRISRYDDRIKKETDQYRRKQLIREQDQIKKDMIREMSYIK